MNNSIPIPIKLEDINPTWLSQILGEKISKEDFKTEANVQLGIGFLSNMTRVQCKSDSKYLNLMVKLLPSEGSDEAMRSFAISGEMDKTEINFYQKVLPDLVEILPELEEYLCKCYYGQYEDFSSVHGRGSVLVLEDMKPQKYYTINFLDNMNRKQVEEMFEFMAKFHLASMALEEEKGMQLTKIYDFLQWTELKGDSMYSMGQEGFMALDRILAEKEVNPRVREAYQKLAPHNDTCLKMLFQEVLKFPCLIHGDLKCNNVLFNDNPELRTKVIDWQTLSYKDPITELAVSIVGALLSLDDLTKENLDKLLKFYYNTFMSQAEKNGLGHLVKRDLEAFSEFFYTWGMSWTLYMYVVFSEIVLEMNFSRAVKAYEFLIVEMNVDQFILGRLAIK